MLEVLICAVLAGLAASGAVAYARFADQTPGSLGQALPLGVEVAASTLALTLSLVVLSWVAAETGDGTVRTSLVLVSNRYRLLVARAAVWPTIATVLLLALTPVVGLLGAAAQLPGSIDPGAMALSLGVAALTVSLVVTLAFLSATILRRGALAMAVAVGCLLVLPLALGVLQVTGPTQLQSLFGYALNALPGTAALKGVSVSSVGQTGWTPALQGLAALATWVLVAAGLAIRQFQREGSTS